MFALCYGLVFVIPIGGADMPVVISVLNACTGTAVAMSGLAINNIALIVAGALVGAAGVTLSIAMAVTSMTRYFGTVAENVALQARVEELQPAQTVYNEYLSAAAQYDKYEYLYAYTETSNENLVEFINELEQILPDSFWTNSFSSDQTGISMSVTVEGKAAAARTILNIRNMQSIEDVQISGITDTKDEAGNSTVTFSITGTYKALTDESAEQTDTLTVQ